MEGSKEKQNVARPRKDVVRPGKRRQEIIGDPPYDQIGEDIVHDTPYDSRGE